MLKLNSRHYRQSLLSLALIFVTASFAIVSSNVNPVSGQIIPRQSTNWVGSIFRRRPKRPLGSRSGQICPIAPGLIDTYIVWSNRPLFLWEYSGDNKPVDLVVREFDSKQNVWTQSVNLTQKKALYGGEKALEPGKIYQWQLSGNNNWALFKIMPTDERQNITEQLQALEQKSNKAAYSSEEISMKKVDFFLNYEIKHQAENKTFNAWSDALLALYQVENPSPDFVNNRKEFVQSLCSPASSNVSKK